MSFTFGHTRVRNFKHFLQDNPRQITRHPYLNFLRHYKRLNPKYGFLRLLRSGARTWRLLKPHEKALYTQKAVMSEYNKNLEDHTFALYPVVFDYQRRSMNGGKNIERSWRKLEYMPPMPYCRFPQIMRYKDNC